jgi:hypothetical protein
MLPHPSPPPLQVLGRPPAPASLAVLLAALEAQNMGGQQLAELSSLLALQRVRPPAGLLKQLAEATGSELPRMEGPLLVSLAWTYAELRVGALLPLLRLLLLLAPLWHMPAAAVWRMPATATAAAAAARCAGRSVLH